MQPGETMPNRPGGMEVRPARRTGGPGSQVRRASLVELFQDGGDWRARIFLLDAEGETVGTEIVANVDAFGVESAEQISPPLQGGGASTVPVVEIGDTWWLLWPIFGVCAQSGA